MRYTKNSYVCMYHTIVMGAFNTGAIGAMHRGPPALTGPSLGK